MGYPVCMKKTRKQPRSAVGVIQGRQMKTLVIRPLARRIKREAARGVKLGRRIFKKLRSVEESIEIIAREIARRAKRNE